MLISKRSALALAATVIAGGSLACARLPGALPTPTTVWLVPAPGARDALTTSGSAGSASPFAGPLIVLDSTTLGPVALLTSARDVSRAADSATARIAVVTTYQGGRYRPESVRALSDDSDVLAASAGAIARAASAVADGVFIDFQGGTPNDLPGLAALARATADSARARGLAPVGIVVPPGDTVGYPTAVLARIADLIVVRLQGEHRPGTSPGALASPDWAARQLALRAVEIGANRVVAELPLFGYRWDAGGSARPITFAGAQALVAAESGSFRRDPATGFLTAAGRDGWTIWVPDARSIELLIAAARRSGVHRIALSGTEGADPDIVDRLLGPIRR